MTTKLYTEDELDQAQDKPRPKGRLSRLDEKRLDDPDYLRQWLTKAFRPTLGVVRGFERMSQDLDQPAWLIVANGSEEYRYRFRQQSDLTTQKCRKIVLAVGSGELRMPHLSDGEIEDVWAALTYLGSVLSNRSELDQAGEWLDALLRIAAPLEGHTLTDSGTRRDALLAFRKFGEFTRLDALAILRSPEQTWTRRPTCLIDSATGEMWLRERESATYLREILGVKPLTYKSLEARFREIGIELKHFEDRRPPHPKANLYRVPKGYTGSPEAEE